MSLLPSRRPIIASRKDGGRLHLGLPGTRHWFDVAEPGSLVVVAMPWVYQALCCSLLLLLTVGCRPSAERALRLQVETIKQTYRVADIEAELRPVYSALLLGNARNVETNAVPPRIRSLPIFVGVSNNLSFMLIGDTKQGLMVWHEEGPVHRGIVYCPFSDGESVARLIHGGNVAIVRWTNGIFFYDFCL